MRDYEEYLLDEYAAYCETTDEPMEFDDWLAGCDYLNIEEV